MSTAFSGEMFDDLGLSMCDLRCGGSVESGRSRCALVPDLAASSAPSRRSFSRASRSTSSSSISGVAVVVIAPSSIFSSWAVREVAFPSRAILSVDGFVDLNCSLVRCERPSVSPPPLLLRPSCSLSLAFLSSSLFLSSSFYLCFIASRSSLSSSLFLSL